MEIGKGKIVIAFILVFAMLLPAGASGGNGLPEPGITPDSPLYVFDRAGEWFQELFAFDAEGKERLRLEQAEERAAEYLALLERGRKSEELDSAETRLKQGLAAVEKTPELEERLRAVYSALKAGFEAREEVLEEQDFTTYQSSLLEARQEHILSRVRIEAFRLGVSVSSEEGGLVGPARGRREAAGRVQELEGDFSELQQAAEAGGLEMPAELRSAFEAKLQEAKEALAAEKYVEAVDRTEEADLILERLDAELEAQ